jgi:hypothetical protein
MILNNPFPSYVRVAFIDYWECYRCGKNYPLELHHIKGRESCSALNASVLCSECHSHMGHTDEEEIYLMGITARFLVRNNYQFREEDIEFWNKYKDFYNKIIK